MSMTPASIGNASSLPTLAFIGAGRIATALAVRLHESGYHITGIFSRTFAHAQALAALTESSAVEDAFPDADILFLTVPDDAILITVAAVAKQETPLLTGAVVHTSGVHSLDTLSMFPDSRSKGSFHPLYPFRKGSRLHGNEGMLVGIEATQPNLEIWLTQIAHAIGGNPAVLKPGSKAHYHAAAVIASNYLITLFDVSLNLMQDAGVSEASAKIALLSLMQGNLDNLQTLSPAQALTGPIARGDVATIARHLSALENTAYEAFYRDMGQLTVNLAPDLDTEARTALQGILKRAKP